MKETSGTKLIARLGLFSTTAIISGTMIGSGIFKKAAPMAGLLGTADLMLLVWLGAGIITLFGALTLAEISAMMPVTGGQYTYYRSMYGDAFAFVSGWSIFVVIQSGSIAAIAYVFSDYFNSVVPLPRLAAESVSATSFSVPILGVVSLLDNIGVKILTCLVIVGLSFINLFGVQHGGRTSSIFTTLKVLAMMAIILLCATSSKGSLQHFVEQPAATPVGMTM